MVTWIRRRKPKLGRYKILLSAKHKGLKDHPKSHGWYRGCRIVPEMLQQVIDYFDGREEDVFTVLDQLEKGSLLVPGIWRSDIVLRTLADPFNEDPEFQSDGYIMGLLIPGNVKKPMGYFRLLAFKWLAWYRGSDGTWDKPPWTIRLAG